MTMEEKLLDLEKKNAVLEYRVQEQHEILMQLRPMIEGLEKMLAGLSCHDCIIRNNDAAVK